MRLEEGTPRRGWPGREAPHVLGNGELRDIIAEEPEFGLDPAPAPGWVSRAMRRISVRSSRSSGGRPADRRRDFQRQ
jgi:hypothetical protein